MNAVSPQSSAELGAGLAYLPLFLEVKDRIVLLIAGGEGTDAKQDLLRRAGARVRQVTGPVELRHFENAVVAVDASGDPETNHLSRRLARAAGVPLNVVDRPALCDFIFPAILDRAPVIVAVSTGGMAPAIARLIRQRLELAIPAGLGSLAMLAGRFRSAVAERLTSYRQSARFWSSLFDGGAAQLALAGRLEDAAVLAEALIAELELEAASEGPAFWTLRITSDDPDLLTVRAARLIGTADVIVHDSSIPAEILALARRDAMTFAVGHKGPSETPDEVLEAHARNDGLAVYLCRDSRL